MKRFASLLGAMVLSAAGWALAAESDAAERAVTVERGSQVYFTYCVSCHGMNGDGNGRRSSKLTVKPSDLRQSYAPAFNVEYIIRKGGEVMGRSPQMPPWEDELSNENIKELVAYLGSIRQR